MESTMARTVRSWRDIECYIHSLSHTIGSSHRARIPSTINWRFRMGPTMKPPSYSLDMGSGTFIEKLENDQVRVERRIFASQEYTELLLAHVTVTRLASKGLSTQARRLYRNSFHRRRTSHFRCCRRQRTSDQCGLQSERRSSR